mgnify:CR=1 FL=1
MTKSYLLYNLQYMKQPLVFTFGALDFFTYQIDNRRVKQNQQKQQNKPIHQNYKRNDTQNEVNAIQRALMNDISMVISLDTC